jgi:dihydrodipicolinate synthase/N-acetylneuraminate lyase
MVEEYMHQANVLREAKGFETNFTVLVGFADQSLPALLAGGAGAIRGLSNIASELQHRRILPLMAICALSGAGLGAAKFPTKKLGFPHSPTMRAATLPTPLNSEEAVEARVGSARLLPVQAEA